MSDGQSSISPIGSGILENGLKSSRTLPIKHEKPMQTLTDTLCSSTPAFNSASTPVWDGPERRQGMSTLELGSIMLSHAIQYLVSEQFAGRRPSVQANREAIAILSRTRLGLGLMERREPARSKIYAQLRAFLR
jgi:hypothetical protein